MVQIAVQTGLYQEAKPEGLRNEQYQSEVTRGSGEITGTAILKALHDGAGLAQREAVRDQQFGAIVPKAPIIMRQPRAGVQGELISADAANWTSCQWYTAPSTLIPGATNPTYVPVAAGDIFCRFTNATGDTDSQTVTIT